MCAITEFTYFHKHRPELVQLMSLRHRLQRLHVIEVPFIDVLLLSSQIKVAALPMLLRKFSPTQLIRWCSIEWPPKFLWIYSVSLPSNSRCRRKERCHNWQVSETLVLIDAKRWQHDLEKNTLDRRHLMESDMTKWMRVAEHVNRVGFSPCICNGNACKSKWNQILPDYKNISNYQCRSG